MNENESGLPKLRKQSWTRYYIGVYSPETGETMRLMVKSADGSWVHMQDQLFLQTLPLSVSIITKYTSRDTGTMVKRLSMIDRFSINKAMLSCTSG